MQNRIATVSLLALMSLGMAVAQQSTPELKHRQPPVTSQNGSVSIPSGIDLQLELLDEINSATAKIGDPFTAKLVQDLSANGTCIAQAGSLVKGRVADVTNSGRRFNGKNTLTLRPESIMTADGRQVTISATMIDTYDRKSFKVDSEGSVSNTAGHYGRMSAITAGVGSVGGWMVAGPVGAIAGGGIGAALPAGRWATKNDPVVLPANTKYWFETARTTSATVAPVASATVMLTPAPDPVPSQPATTSSNLGAAGNNGSTIMLTPAPMPAPTGSVAAKPSPTPATRANSQPENEPSSGVMHPPEDSDPE
jgi:hypothetical protein